jgi:hypothetical protein
MWPIQEELNVIREKKYKNFEARRGEVVTMKRI